MKNEYVKNILIKCMLPQFEWGSIPYFKMEKNKVETGSIYTIIIFY